MVELHDDRPNIGPILAACRNTQPWHWFMKDGWIPVGTYPPTTPTYNPPGYSDQFQNGNGNNQIPNAWAQTKSNGNKVFVWDVSWDAGVDDIGISAVGIAPAQGPQRLDSGILNTERLLQDLIEPAPGAIDRDPFE